MPPPSLAGCYAYWQLAGRLMPIGTLPDALCLLAHCPVCCSCPMPEAFSAKPYLAFSLIMALTKPHISLKKIGSKSYSKLAQTVRQEDYNLSG